MLGTIRQTYGVTRANLKGLGARGGLVWATMLCVALAVATFLGLDALKQGLNTTLEQSGARDVALVMRGGSQAEINSIVTREQVDVLRGAPGLTAISPEVNLIVDGYRREDGQRVNISFRGLTEAGRALRRDVRLAHGRWPSPGLSELAIGASVARTYRDLELGAVVSHGSTDWTVVGVFESNGSIAESEIWADLAAAQSLFNRPNIVQSVRIGIDDDRDLASLSALSDSDPRLQLAVQSEADYYAAQAARTSELAQQLAWPLAVLMSIGAVVGALNTMLAAVSARSAEIATYRVIGFRRTAVCAGLVIEGVVICVAAGLIGAALAYLLLDGLSATTLGGGITRISYSLTFTYSGFWQGVSLAAAIGVLGAIVPAILAALRPVPDGLAE